MRLLLDECVPRKFRNGLAGHDCCKKNGELLSLAEKADFQVFLTLDRGLEYEQNLQRRTIAIILIRTKSSRLADLLPHSTEILRVLGSIRPGELVKVG
jgi:hypothetical protein